MSDEAQQQKADAREPVMLRLTEKLLDDPDGGRVSSVTDMWVLFYIAGGTIVGCLLAACLFPAVHPYTPLHSNAWIAMLLASVALGSLLGCLAIALILNTQGLIAWENRHPFGRKTS